MNSNALAATALASEQTLTSSELEQARLYLQQTQNGIAGAIKGLSEEQWAFKPSPDQWSIGEIVEHIVFVQDRVLGPIRDQLANAPPLPPNYDYKHIDEIVINQFPNRLTKFSSPHRPVGDLVQSAALDRMVRNHARLEEYLETTPDLRQHALDAPPLKAISNGAYESMDGYQWILAVAAHTERHTKQILEVIAETSFPGSRAGA